MRFAIQALIIGLILYLITRIQILIVEVTWLRRYIVRLLTEEMKSSKAAPLADPPLVVTPLESMIPSGATVSSDTVVATLLQGIHGPLCQKKDAMSVEEIVERTSEASVELEDSPIAEMVEKTFEASIYPEDSTTPETPLDSDDEEAPE